MNSLDFGVLAPDHPVVGSECSLCHQELHAGDHVRGVMMSPLDDKAKEAMREGREYTANVRIAHGAGTCAGPMTLHCTCCGHEEQFTDLGDAFQAGWDEPDHMSSWPISCPLCPGVAAMGVIDHSHAHERWEREGRPESFEASQSAGDLPEL